MPKWKKVESSEQGYSKDMLKSFFFAALAER